MSYRIEIGRRAQSQLAGLPRSVRLRFEQHIGALAHDPRPPGTKALHGALEPLRSLRVGDYRAIYLVDDEARIIRLTHIGHRSRVYQDAEREA